MRYAFKYKVTTPGLSQGDLSMKQLSFCMSCGSWVILQIVLKQNFFKQRQTQKILYMKLLLKMYVLYYTDVENIVK